MTNQDAPLPRLPRRKPDCHKGDAGVVAVVGGSVSGAGMMLGAPALGGLAALRAGAGLVRLVMPAPLLVHGLSMCPCATGIALPVDSSGDLVAHESAAVLDQVVSESDCLVIGPGLGRSAGARAISLRAAQQEDKPVVIDADAINNLAEVPDFAREIRASCVLTPHPGEFRRLCDGLGLPGSLGLASSRERAAEQLAQRLGCIVILKGRGTVVSDGQRTWTNTTGHPCMATAGSGDVLSGLIAAVVSQWYSAPPPENFPAAVRAAMSSGGAKPLGLFDAARIAVHAHGLAGEAWARRRRAQAGMLATELADELPLAIESVLEPRRIDAGAEPA